MVKVTESAAHRATLATIRSVEAIRVALPLKKPMLMAGVRIETAQNVLVRIEASDGTVGWGEATSAPTMTGEFAESIVAAVGHLTPLLTGQDVCSHAMLARRCQQAIQGNGARNRRSTWRCSISPADAQAFPSSIFWAARFASR